MIRIVPVLLVFSFVLGNVLSLSVSETNGHIYLIDLVFGVLTLINLPWFITNYKDTSKALGVFVFILIVTWLLGLFRYGISAAIVASAYVLRFITYSYSLYLFIYQFKQHKLEQILYVISLTFTAIGIVQYFLLPDLRLLGGGWDPHYYRIVSTLLDPNFTSLVLVFILIYFYQKQSNLWWMAYVAMVFTYSRSGFLAFAVSHMYLGITSKRYLHGLLFLGLLAATLFILPRPGGEGVRLERTSTMSLRVQNWVDTTELIRANPWLGIGFNYLRSVRVGSDRISHSAGGVDSSLLFVTVTTGVLGLSIYILYLAHLYTAFPNLRPALLAAAIHSLFNNSLFYPYVLAWISMYAALTFGTPPSSPGGSGSQPNRWLQRLTRFLPH